VHAVPEFDLVGGSGHRLAQETGYVPPETVGGNGGKNQIQSREQYECEGSIPPRRRRSAGGKSRADCHTMKYERQRGCSDRTSDDRRPFHRPKNSASYWLPTKLVRKALNPWKS
jgi:hypothetical protein